MSSSREAGLAEVKKPREVGWTTWDGEPNQEGADGLGLERKRLAYHCIVD